MSLSIQFEQTRIILSPTNPKRHDTYHIVRSNSPQYPAKHDLNHTKPTELEYTGVVSDTGKLIDLFTRATVMPDRRDSETVQAEADRFKLLGHVVRLQILDILRRNPECVCHLEAALGKPQPYISQQLRLLREAGVISDSKDGLNVYYHLIDAQVASLLTITLGPVSSDTPRARQVLPDCVCPKCNAPAVQEIKLITTLSPFVDGS